MQTNETKMFTSNFYQYFGPGRISIARGAPRGMSGFKVYRKLNPGSWFRDAEFYNDEALFRAKYFNEVLKPLNPQQIWNELQSLVSGQGHPPVLLCHENIHKPGQWCHRRMVADWFENELGILVPEKPVQSKAPANDRQPSLLDAL